jgi:hypothetical protein
MDWEHPDLFMGICRRKVAQLVDEQGFAVDGIMVRRGARIMIVTNLGRVESYLMNEFGGIDLERSITDREQQLGRIAAGIRKEYGFE